MSRASAAGASVTEYTICIDTVNRDVRQYPDTNDLVLEVDSGRIRRGTVQLNLGSAELPGPPFTIQDQWKNFYFDEGFRVTGEMAGRAIQIDENGVITTIYLPLYWNPFSSINVIDSTTIEFKTTYDHALELRSMYGLLENGASPLPITICGINTGDTAELLLTGDNVITVVDATTFLLTVNNYTGPLGPFALFPDAAGLNAPEIESPVALANLLNYGLTLKNFYHGKFVYDRINSNFIFQTTYFRTELYNTGNCLRTSVKTYSNPPDIFFVEINPISPTDTPSLYYQMGFGSSVLNTLPTGQWAIIADQSPSWRSNVRITPGFYTGDANSLGSDISIQFNRLYFDNAPSRPPDSFLFSNAFGSSFSIALPTGRFFPTQLATFLQESMNTVDTASLFNNPSVLGSNVYSVQWVITTTNISPTVEVGNFVFSCQIGGTFGLEFGDSAGASSLPLRLGFMNTAYRGGSVYTGKEIGFPISSSIGYATRIMQLIVLGQRKAYRIDTTVQRVLSVEVSLPPGNELSCTTDVSLPDRIASGLQPGLIVSLGLPNRVFARVLSIIDPFSFLIGPILNQTNLTPTPIPAFLCPYQSPTTFNVYWNAPTSSLNKNPNLSRRNTQTIFPYILGFDYADLMAPLPFQSCTTFNLDPPPYLLLQVLDVKASSFIQHNFNGDNLTNIIAKVIFFPAFQMQRGFPNSISFNGSEILTKLHFRWLTPDHELINFNKRNWSATMQFAVLSESTNLICS
jgi:hypothetical protein